ncbi:uncharacterized protein A4U43_C08F15190 [Asparagus officinalis]|uniref:abscisic acid 8'-hydroxylase 3-like n=1 Tax=Asparagus officinalis TaxID=4686 RepID=UPI00098E5BC5|nr:abscisic acid 8'-hydroxylase 3-like [Asparagus officinalis]ONK60175.1 uncharacterized protein A4U43_C08F15190 [Asparagus officinalis]
MQTNNLDDDQITDNIIGVLFAARDTSASVLTWIVKFLSENHTILQAVTSCCLSLLHLSGYLIPKGWKALPLFRNIHHSEEYFHHPDKFDPSRFDVAPKPNTFLLFGSGTYSCPGNELAKLEMLVLLHHLTTKYRWTVSGPGREIQFSPFALPWDGLPVTFT